MGPAANLRDWRETANIFKNIENIYGTYWPEFPVYAGSIDLCAANSPYLFIRMAQSDSHVKATMNDLQWEL